jgi:hypothetical protein
MHNIEGETSVQDSRSISELGANGAQPTNPAVPSTTPALQATKGKTKRAKLKDSASEEGEVIIAPKPCHLQRMPFELLAMILKNTSSPRDVLAVARCNKYYCATLVESPDSLRIWREVRKNSELPKPTPNFTESSYAAFLFDGGECEVGDSNIP